MPSPTSKATIKIRDSNFQLSPEVIHLVQNIDAGSRTVASKNADILDIVLDAAKESSLLF
jgi:hypothetical protein